MRFQYTFEKDEVMIKLFEGGVEFLSALSAELEIEYTPATYEVRASDNSCLEPPSGADVEVIHAETTLELYDDKGEEVGKLIYKGADFFESLVDLNDEGIELDVEDMY